MQRGSVCACAATACERALAGTFTSLTKLSAPRLAKMALRAATILGSSFPLAASPQLLVRHALHARATPPCLGRPWACPDPASGLGTLSKAPCGQTTRFPAASLLTERVRSAVNLSCAENTMPDTHNTHPKEHAPGARRWCAHFPSHLRPFLAPLLSRLGGAQG